MAKQKRRTWTDEERERLIRGAEGAPLLGEYLKSQGVNSHSWFTSMRRKYFASHPNFSLEAPAPAVLSYKAANDAQRRQMIAEYKALPVQKYRPGRPSGPTPRAQWLTAHGIQRTSLINSIQWKQEKARPTNGTAKRGRPLGSTNKPKQVSTVTPTHVPQPHAPASLDDAINAFKVERDMLSVTIDKLERMRAGKF